MMLQATMQRARIFAPIAAILTALAACSDLINTTPLRAVNRVVVAPTSATLFRGAEKTLDAVALDWNDNVLRDREIQWESEASTIARVSTRGVVTAVAPGTTRVYATSEGRRGQAVITVLPLPVAWIDVGPTEITLDEGATAVIVAQPRDAADAALEGRAVVWGASNPTVANVDQSGNVVAHRAGQSTITATSEGKSAAVRVTIRSIPVATITLSANALDLEASDTAVVTAILKDATGRILEGRILQWSTSNPSVAIVSANGVVNAKAKGAARLTAVSGDAEATVDVTVELPPAADLLYQRVVPGRTELFVLGFGRGAVPERLPVGAGARRPSASPSGREIVFVAPAVDSAGTGTTDIFAVERAGTHLRRLSSVRGADDAPAWSPATRPGYIAFTHKNAATARTDIWVMRADGAAPRNLTADMSANAVLGDPAWSPDGEWIAFSVSSYLPDAVLGSLWLMRADGSDKRQLTTNSWGSFDLRPSWSPDGKFIVFVREDLAIVNVATGHVTAFAFDGWLLSPAWSPDGRHIAFSFRRGDVFGANFDLYTIRPDGSDLRLRRRDQTDPLAHSVGAAWIARER